MRARALVGCRTGRHRAAGWLRLALIGLLAVAVAVPGAASGAVSAQLSDDDRKEVEQGREADKQIEAQFGFYEDEELQAYVQRTGELLVSVSERSQLPWTFRVLDSPAVNAFALPGGFTYVTRGLLAYMNSEAELAGVLGHEIGHVTGKHSSGRSLTSTLINLALLGGGLFSGTVRDVLRTGLPQQAAGLFLLKYSRDQERDADERGIRYATAAGYDPRGIGGFFQTLQSLEEQSDRKKIPGWVSTHPQVDDRIERTDRWASEALARYGLGPDDLILGHPEHVYAIDGILFGENPREGYTDGERFLHPDLRFALDFPIGWTVQNDRAAVTAVDPGEGAYIELTLAQVREGDRAVDYVADYLRRLRAQVEESGRTEVNGLEAIEATFLAPGQRGSYAVTGYWITYDERIYQVLGVTSPRAYSRYSRTLVSSMSTFRELTDETALAIEPARVSVVELPQLLQLRGVLEENPEVSVSPATIAILNHRELDDVIEVGSLVKLVFGGLPAKER